MTRKHNPHAIQIPRNPYGECVRVYSTPNTQNKTYFLKQIFRRPNKTIGLCCIIGIPMPLFLNVKCIFECTIAEIRWWINN